MRPASALLPLCLLSLGPQGWPAQPFVSRLISPAGEERYRETQLPADIDKDGDMDFFSGESRDRPSWWFQRLADGGWKRWLVSDTNIADVGAVAMDVDGDGWVDKVTAGYWYRNPGFAPGKDPSPAAGFRACRYSPLEYLHDMLQADLDGDGREDVITIDYGGIHWYRNPPADSACGMWKEGMILAYPVPMQDHGGIAVGDLDGDGDPDVSRMDRWYENADGGGGAWTEHANIPLVPARAGYWGLSGRAWIGDLDGDGHNDLAEAECDLANGRVAWFSNPDGKGLRWVPHPIADSAEGQDFHSLLARDFDGDGDSDFFSAGAGSSEKAPKAYLWENLDGHGGSWKQHVIQDEGLQIHDAAGVDMDGDGDIDILALDWALGSQFYLENQAVPNPDAISRGHARGEPARPLRAKGAGKGHAGWRPAFPRDGREHAADGRRIPARR